jgi:TetR/AcrR family transcriptional regulator, mexJK operon transcriptional repressor
MISRVTAQQKQDELLKVAAELFFDRGFESVSIDEVVKRTGGSKTTVYSYFGGKEGIFLAAVRKTVRDLVDPIVSFDVSASSPVDGLQALGVKYLELVAHKQARQILVTIVAEARRFPCLGWEFFNAGPRIVVQKMSRCISDWQDRGLLQPGNPDLMAEHFLGALSGTKHTALLLGVEAGLTGASIEQRVRETTALFLAGARKPTNIH